MKSPVGTLSDRTVLRKQDGEASPRQVLRLPGSMRPPRLCCGIKHTKSEILAPYAPQISSFDLLSLFSPGACPPFRADTGRQHALRGGREGKMRPKRARASQPCALKNQHRKVLLCGLGRVGRVNSSSRTFWGCCFGSGAAGPYIFTGPQGAAQPELRRVWRSAKETCL